jgi:hypothetical protein
MAAHGNQVPTSQDAYNPPQPYPYYPAYGYPYGYPYGYYGPWGYGPYYGGIALGFGGGFHRR